MWAILKIDLENTYKNKLKSSSYILILMIDIFRNWVEIPEIAIVLKKTIQLFLYPFFFSQILTSKNLNRRNSIFSQNDQDR